MRPARYVSVVLGVLAALSMLAGVYAWTEAGRFTRAGYASCAYIDKKLAMGSSVSPPKLVVVAGSNAAAGIKVRTIADALSVRGFNFALVATFSPGFQLYEARKILRPGDAVLLSFEYLAYEYQTPTSGLIDAVYSCGTDFWLSLDWTERLFFVFAVRPQRFFDTMLFDRRTISQVQALLAHQVNAYGDLVDEPAPKGQPDVGTHQPLIIRFRDESSGVRAIRDFVAWAKANKVSVFATWPNTLYFPQYQAYPAFSQIRNYYRSLGVEVIGEPQDAMFSSELLSDTIYHLSGRGIAIRTNKLIQQLEADHVFMTWVEAARR
jgi:hypothetical protein